MTIDEFQRALRQAIQQDPKEIAEIIHRDILRHINESRSIDGKPYPELAASTIKQKERKGEPLKPIIGIKDAIRVNVVGNDLEIEVDKEYGSYLQDRYNFAGLSDEAVQEIDRWLQKRIDTFLGD